MIDGSGPHDINQVFNFTHRQVERFARHCAFFRWTLEFPTITLDIMDTLVLFIEQVSQNLNHLNVDWRDAQRRSVLGEDTGSRKLYISAEESTLFRAV
jgi:hypothetical protein